MKNKDLLPVLYWAYLYIFIYQLNHMVLASWLNYLTAILRLFFFLNSNYLNIVNRQLENKQRKETNKSARISGQSPEYSNSPLIFIE